MNIKEYAKQAKDRLRNGFWTENKAKHSDDVVATRSVSNDNEVHNRLSLMINNFSQYEQEEQFYNKVVEILESEEVIINPLMVLADKQYIATLSPSEKQSYMLKLSNKYQQAVSRYNKQ